MSTSRKLEPLPGDGANSIIMPVDPLATVVPLLNQAAESIASDDLEASAKLLSQVETILRDVNQTLDRSLEVVD